MTSKLSIRDLSLFAVLGTILFALKMAMAGLPNIEPVTLLVLVYTLVFGRRALWAVYTYVLLEFITWGFSFWTVSYLYIWLLLFFLVRLFRRMDSALSWAILAAAFGLGFGLLCAPVCLLFGGWAYALSWWVAGIPYDLLHCAGNFAMTLLLYRPCRRVLQHLSQQY